MYIFNEFTLKTTVFANYTNDNDPEFKQYNSFNSCLRLWE